MDMHRKRARVRVGFVITHSSTIPLSVDLIDAITSRTHIAGQCRYYVRVFCGSVHIVLASHGMSPLPRMPCFRALLNGVGLNID